METPDAPPTGRGAIAFAGVLLVVMVLAALGARGEILQSWGITGEPGTFTATSCGRDVVSGSGDTTRVMCEGEFAPDSGAAPYEATLYHDGEAGATYEGRAEDDTVYRTDWTTRWSSVSLPLIPLGLLWLTPGIWLALRRPGVMDRAQKVSFLAFWATPAALVVLAGGLGLLVGVATS